MKNSDFVNPEDGLLWCGKCHTPKQTKVTFRGRTDVQFCLCKCGQERLAREEAERKREQAIADKRRRKRTEQAKTKKVDLILELSDGTRGHIKGKILSKE